jgi:hypothetical protein
MSIKKPLLVGVGILLLAAFIILAINDVTKKRELRELQEVQIKSKSLQVKEIKLEQDKVEEKLNKAIEDKNASQEEVNKAKEEAEALRIKTQELEAQLQAKLEAKNKLAAASTKTINAVTATQTASAAPYSGGSLEAIIKNAAVKNGLDPDWFYNLAKCESTWNPNAVNYNYYENGHPSGLFQHLSGYWPARAAAHGYAGASVFDAEANANVTAAMWRTGSHLWECQ